jgi:hypothetical protein
MNAAGVATHKGLQTLELFNEPFTISLGMGEGPVSYVPAGQSWGDVCYRIFNMVGNGSGTLNPHAVGRVFAFKSLFDLCWRVVDATGQNVGFKAVIDPNAPHADLLFAGFGPPSAPSGQHPADYLDRWIIELHDCTCLLGSGTG